MRRLEPWLISYGLLGLTQSGLVPVLMPLVARHDAAAGITFAAFSLSGILAPILGGWADATGRHRDLLAWGALAAGALLLAYEAAAGPLRVLLAAAAGLGCMVATTAGNVVATMGIPKGVLTVLGLTHGGATGWLVLAGFALVQFVWPLLAVAANALAVRLAPQARGESVGLFNATTALASAVGAALAGVLFSGGGFAVLAAATLAAIGAGLGLGRYWLRQPYLHADGVRAQGAASVPGTSIGAARAVTGDTSDHGRASTHRGQ